MNTNLEKSFKEFFETVNHPYNNQEFLTNVLLCLGFNVNPEKWTKHNMLCLVQDLLQIEKDYPGINFSDDTSWISNQELVNGLIFFLSSHPLVKDGVIIHHESVKINESISNKEIEEIVNNLTEDETRLIYGLMGGGYDTPYSPFMKKLIIDHIKRYKFTTAPGRVLLPNKAKSTSEAISKQEILPMFGYDVIKNVASSKNEFYIAPSRVNESVYSIKTDYSTIYKENKPIIYKDDEILVKCLLYVNENTMNIIPFSEREFSKISTIGEEKFIEKITKNIKNKGVHLTHSHNNSKDNFSFLINENLSYEKIKNLLTKK
jgi:hypothetical protein